MTASQDAASCFNEIFNATQRDVLALITAKCGHPDDIGDIFQDTYMELFQVIQRHGPAHLTNGNGLAVRIAKRKIARYHAKRSRNPVIVSTRAGDDEDLDMLELEADEFAMEDVALNAVLLEQASQFLLRKPPDVRKIFYLFYHLGMTIPKIAKQLAMSESNVKNKLYRTVNELQTVFR